MSSTIEPNTGQGQDRNFFRSFVDKARHAKPVDKVTAEMATGFIVATTPLVTAGLNYIAGSPFTLEATDRVMGVQLWVGAAMFFFGLGHAIYNSRGGQVNETSNEIPTTE